ncbi:hypothetical protein FE257_012762 [Aspergillus nanangensis]|uniref:C2H2-type domain-containing protein n=1 Tax=Aspergillus nanangensis TaxID=2582783 RepID=A0AAD4CFH4_ASPNN|nr:hypothetical protein FE257_012762 [Aspergillus nanangensis]
MPRAAAGTTKALSNKMKAKGLGRLRWYCQACERQMRDENGYKCHVQSESHVRQMLLIGEDPKKHIEEFSKEFIKNFLDLLKTTHGEKQVNANQFYQQVIAEKEHIHMNATKWNSLSQFVGQLGRESLCRVEETDKGLFISYVDRSPDTLKRREAIMKKERQDRGDEEREQRQIQEQVERARREDKETEEVNPEAKNLQRNEGEKVKLSFGAKPTTNTPGESKVEATSPGDKNKDGDGSHTASATPEASTTTESPAPAPATVPPSVPKMSLSLGGNKPKNVFASAVKKNPLAGKKGPVMEQPKKMSEQERIMKAEMEAMERKRNRGMAGMPNAKRPRVS